MDPLYNASWYRVSELRPALTPRARFCLHRYRGASWYVVQSPSSGRVHRLTPEAYAFVGLMNGVRTVQEIWQLLLGRLRDAAPTQDEALTLLATLHAADLVRCDLAPDGEALLRGAREAAAREGWQRWNPLALRVPLAAPDAWLTRAVPWIRRVFSRGGALLWGAAVSAGALAALTHAGELAAAARELARPDGALALALTYPCVKALHELGHAAAVKRWGGAVHQLGLTFAAGVPLPYVDASAASVFPEKGRRMLVGAAGIAVELLLAALAVLLWLAAEPGPLRQAAAAVFSIGGLSTLLFNGNPLLRYDGYYVLADWLEIPDLAEKGSRYLGALGRRWILGERLELPATTPGEVPWLVGHAALSGAYRLVLLFGLALYLAGHFFAVGVALALFAVGREVIWPLARLVRRVLADPTLGEGRGRALLGSAALAAGLALGALAVPLPLRTRAEGVIWLPDEAHVRAGTDGFVLELLTQPYAEVARGALLVRMQDPAGEKRLRVLEAEQRELRARLYGLERTDRVQAEIMREKLAESDAALARAREQAGEVLIRSRAAGRFVLEGTSDWIGRYVRQGQVIGYVVEPRSSIARVVVPQHRAALLREQTRAVWVRPAHDPGRVVPARIAREVPAASDRLPTRALGTAGGGATATDPADRDGLRTLEPVFQFDLALPADADLGAAGARVQVRFDHPAEPAAWRAYRALRRVFLRQLGL